MRFTEMASTKHARTSIHASTCPRNFLDKAKRHKAYLCAPSPIEGETWQEARELLEAQLKADGRDDILVTICPCAKGGK